MPLTRNNEMTYLLSEEYTTPAGPLNWQRGNQTLAEAGFDLPGAQAEFLYYWQRWQAMGRTGADFLLLNVFTAAREDAIWSGHAGAWTSTCQSRVYVVMPPGRYKSNYPLTIHFGQCVGHGSSEFYTNGADYGGTFGQGGTSIWKNRTGWVGSQSLIIRASAGAVAASPGNQVDQVVPVDDASWNTCYVGSRFIYRDKNTGARLIAKGGSPGARTVTLRGDVGKGFPALSVADLFILSEEMNVFQSATWGDPNLYGYNEAFQYRHFRVVGDTDEDVYNPAKEDAAMAIWDMGSNAFVHDVFTDDFFGGGFHCTRGTYCNFGQIATFRHMRYGIYLQGGGQINVSSGESDECPAYFLAEAGYDRPSYFTGNFDWTKIETGEAPSRPYSKGTMLFDVHGSGNLTFGHVQWAAVNSMPNCLMRWNSDMDNDGQTLDNPSSRLLVSNLQIFGPVRYLFHDVFNRRKYAMHAPGGASNYNGYWGTQVKDIDWINDPSKLATSKWHNLQPLNNVAPGRLQPLNIDPWTGNTVGSWDDIAGTPAYTYAPAAGPVSNPPATPVIPPFAANATVTMSAPVVNVGQTSQATVSVFDQYGASFPSTGGVWGIVSGSGSISGGGLVTATGPGAIIVSFTLGGSSWYAQVTVNAVAPPTPVPNTVNVTLPASTLQVGQTMQAQVSVQDQNAQPMTPVGSWSISAGGANATINGSTGLITAIAAGPVTVRYQAVGGANPFDTEVLTVVAAPPVPVPSTVVVTLPQNTLQVGQTMQATVAILDQNSQPIAASGVWSIVSGQATINGITGHVTPTAPGSVIVRFQASGGSSPAGQATFTATAVTPPQPVPLFDITFQGLTATNLPGMTPQQETWKAGAVVGSEMRVSTNTVQKHAAPIAGVKRIELIGFAPSRNEQDRWLNNRVRTNANRRFILDTPAPTTSDPVISPAFTVGSEQTIEITFPTPETITHLFGGGDNTYYTFPMNVKRVRYWAQ